VTRAGLDLIEKVVLNNLKYFQSQIIWYFLKGNDKDEDGKRTLMSFVRRSSFLNVTGINVGGSRWRSQEE
jgi:hypothetical protein